MTQIEKNQQTIDKMKKQIEISKKILKLKAILIIFFLSFNLFLQAQDESVHYIIIERKSSAFEKNEFVVDNIERPVLWSLAFGLGTYGLFKENPKYMIAGGFCIATSFTIDWGKGIFWNKGQIIK